MAEWIIFYSNYYLITANGILFLISFEAIEIFCEREMKSSVAG